MAGLLGAFAAGAGQAGAQAVDSWMKFDKQMELLQRRIGMESEQRRADKTWELDEGEKRQQGLLSRTGARAQEIAGSRVMNSPEDIAQSDAAAKAYSDAAARGDISQEDANLGYGAASDYLKRNEQKNTTVTDDDRMQAARDTGALSERDYFYAKGKDAAIETRQKIAEMQNSAQWAKMDAQTQVALAKLDAAIAKGEKSGNIPTQIQQIEYLIQSGMPRDQATNLVYHGEAKVGEYETRTTKETMDDGREVSTTRKTKIGGSQTQDKPTGRSFVWQNGKLVPK